MQFNSENLNFITLTESQTRQYIDAEAAWRALEDADVAAREVRGSMMWRTQAGRRYLLRVASKGSQTSLGVESAENELIYQRFMARKVAVEARRGRFTQVVVATNGNMATMNVPAPVNFVRIKTAISQRADRDPLKRPKDHLQAHIVQALLDEYGLGYQAVSAR